MPRVEFTTKDGVTIVGEYRPLPDAPGVLFLHMMPATKESWEPLAAALGQLGFTTLAIDLRGHGESTAGPDGARLDYNTFSEAQHQAAIQDVDAACHWLAGNGVNPSQLALVGASIGANLAIRYAAEHGDIPAVVALSPGLAYHGVTAADALARLPRDRKTLLAASEEDAESYSSLDALVAAKPDAEVRRLAGAGHGTRMLEREAGFLEYVALWISHNVPHDHV